MLEIKLGRKEVYNEETAKFSYVYEGPTIQIEHSLLSLSKWEAKHQKPFMSGKDDKSRDELLDYIRMTVVGGDADELIECMTAEDLKAIIKYISEDKQSATWFAEDQTPSKPKQPQREIVTSELIYYMMFANQIPMECEQWNLNRLLTLIRIFSEKNKEHDPNRKKMSKNELMSRHRALNEANKRRFNTKG